MTHSQPVPEVEETHTHNPFDLSKPLRSPPIPGQPLMQKWYEPNWFFARRKRKEAEWAQFIAKGDLYFREKCRECYLFYK